MKVLEAEPWKTYEGQQYLAEFQAMEAHKLAVIKIGGDLIEDSSELTQIAADLSILWGLGLKPMVVHGGGGQITKGLRQAGIESQIVDGMRVTSAEAAICAAGILKAVNQRLCAAVDSFDGQPKTAGLTSGVFSATLKDKTNFVGFPGHVQANSQAVEAVISDGLIPVVSCAGSLAVANTAEASPVKPVNINADVAAVALAAALQPKKFISLTKMGAVLDKHLQPISSLTPDQALELIDDGTVNEGMGPKVLEALRLLDHGVHDIVITSPKALLKELFTSEGDGTIIQAQTAVNLHIQGKGE